MYYVIKRFADIVLSSLSILLLSPLLITTAVVLKCTGEHLVFYRQKRVGKDYHPFDVYKFVTMRSNSEKYGTITTKNDSRVLPLGKILRQTKINEFPQLFNVLFGHMSVVGPRPLVESEVALYSEGIREVVYADNQPGLTGMGSLFFRNEDDIIEATGKTPEKAYEEDIMPVKGALEVWYRTHKNLILDLKIAFLTAWAIVSPSTAPIVSSFHGADGLNPIVLDRYQELVDRVTK